MKTRHSRSGHDNRHRQARSMSLGPDLSVVSRRREEFINTVASTASYLISMWPDELEHVSVEVADMPWDASISTWFVDKTAQRVVLFRHPIQRASIRRNLDGLHQELLTEFYVIQAFSELLGKSPWDLAPGRYHPF